MPLQAKPVPSVTGGVTQHPAKTAPAGRLAACTNWIPWAERGLTCRPYTRWRSEVYSDPVPDARLRPADLGGESRYVLALSHQSVLVRKYDGSTVPVWTVTRNAAGTPTGSSAPSFEYLDLRTVNRLRASGEVGEDSCEAFTGGDPAWARNNLPESGVAQANAASTSAVRSPLGWQPVPNDQTSSTLSHYAALTVGSHASQTGSWDKNINGGFPSGRLKVSCYVDTSHANFSTTEWVRLAVHDPDLGSPNTFYAEFLWSSGATSLPTTDVDSTTGDEVGLTATVEQLESGGNEFRIQIELDMTAISGNSNAPAVGDTATFSFWMQSNASSTFGVHAWGVHAHFGGDGDVFEDYAYAAHSLRSTTIVDTTFLVNPNIVTAVDSSDTAPDKAGVFGTIQFDGVGGGSNETVDADDAMLVFVKQGKVSSYYYVDVVASKGATTQTISVTVTTGSGASATDDDADVIATAIETAINADASNDTSEANQTLIVKAVAADGTCALYVKTGWTVDSFSVTDNEGGPLLAGIHDEVTSQGDLPVTAISGFRVKLVGTSEVAGSAAFARAVLVFQTEGADDVDAGHWEEGPWYEKQLGLDTDTLPHVLIRRVDDASGTVTGAPLATYFEYGVYDFEDAIVGDDDINPVPSFVTTENNPDRRILDLAIYKNRLVITSDQNVAMSESNRFGNFWRTTHLTLPDSERIDVAVSHSKESIIRHFGTVGGRPLLFSSQSVFSLDQGATLTPSTVGFTAILGVGSHETPFPASLGPITLFVPEGSEDGTALRAVFLQGEDRAASDDLSEDVPSLIGLPPLALAVHPELGVAFLLSQADQTAVGLARVRVTRDGIEAAWAQLDFGATVTSIEVLRNELVMLVQHDGDVHLESMPIELEPLDTGLWAPSLDRRITEADLSSRTYDSGTGRTTLTLPYTLDTADEARVAVVTRTGSSHGAALTVSSASGSSVVVTGDHTSDFFYVGVTRDKSAQLLEYVARDREGTPRASANVSVRRVSVDYVDTGRLDVERVAPVGTSTDQFTASSASTLEDGSLSVEVGTEPRASTVTLKNPSYFPATVDAIEWGVLEVVRGR